MAEGVLGKEFKGVLISDCFLAYDALGYEQSKCALHLLRRCKGLIGSKSGRAVKFSEEVAELLRSGIELKGWRGEMSEEGYGLACLRLEAHLDRLLFGEYSDADNVRFAKLLRKHGEKLLKFLYVEAVDATNNLAERELRPGVIVRKTNGCNRIWVGDLVTLL
mgnify:CR=1 FL=1